MLGRMAFVSFVLTCCVSHAVGQVYTDSFSYPNGSNVPGWTEKRGDWRVENGRIFVTRLDSGPGHGYITKDGYNLRNSVTEATVHYVEAVNTVKGVGLLAREFGGPTSTRLVMCKAHDTGNPQPRGFDYFDVWEYPSEGGPSLGGSQMPVVASCRVRFIVVDREASMLVDNDLDGIWERWLTRDLLTEFDPGETGCMGAHLPGLNLTSPHIDDFALFDAVLTSPDSTNNRRIGNPVVRVGATLTLNLHGRTPNAAYLAACSLSNSPGIPIDTRRIPLTPDGLTIASLVAPAIFVNFTGTLDGSASATAAIRIPAEPALGGQRFFTAFVETVPTAPSGVAAISNDLPTLILP